MNTKIIMILLWSFMSLVVVNAQNTSKKSNPAGTWNFEAPAAPYGYNSGTIEVVKSGQKYNATMTFTSNGYKLAGENVKVDGNNISFTAYVESENVKVQLKMENNSKMSGKANYSEGEIPLTLYRAGEKK
jgi:hypothetical protein